MGRKQGTGTPSGTTKLNREEEVMKTGKRMGDGDIFIEKGKKKGKAAKLL